MAELDGFTRRLCCLAGVVVMGVCAGCWSSAPPGRVAAYGEVKVAGTPIPDGQIMFESIEDGAGGGATGIGPDGKFQLFLRPSTYRVGIVSVEGGIGPAGFSAVERSKIRVPSKYALPSSSGVEVRVDANHRHVSLDLKP